MRNTFARTNTNAKKSNSTKFWRTEGAPIDIAHKFKPTSRHIKSFPKGSIRWLSCRTPGRAYKKRQVLAHN